MNQHPACEHPVSNMSDDYLGVECCLCAGAPCEAVTVQQAWLHRDFDLALYAEVSHVPPF